MKKFITYRLAGVGVWHYEFCLNGKSFGNVVSRVSRSEPARIEGPGISWYSHFDMDRDIVPGVSRKVKDSRTGRKSIGSSGGSRIYMRFGQEISLCWQRSGTETIFSGSRAHRSRR